ncbi:hypothetical protein, partial [Bacillus cereus group sp. BC235]|uniref:hypothetical protein n=1 Tax=Bacillus cereus group sp. BC235 TaxID=3445336 RepID=UPI003F69CADB
EKLATEKFSRFPAPFGALYTLFSFFALLRAHFQFDVCYLKMTPKFRNQPLKNKKSVIRFSLLFRIIHVTGGIMSLAIVHTRAALGVNAPPIT